MILCSNCYNYQPNKKITIQLLFSLTLYLKKKAMFKKTLILISVLSASYLTGCASSPTTSADKDASGKETAAVTDPNAFGDHKPQGFLSDYSKISKTKDKDSGSYKYVDPTADFSKYNKLIVDRIKLFFKNDSDYKGIDPDELKQLTDYFYEAIHKALGDAYPMVKEVGPDVLRLRVAITDLVPNNTGASITTLLVPFLWLGDASSGVATGNAGGTVFTGQAAVELEVLDSVSSKQLGAHIDTETGQKYNYAHGVGEGVKGYMHSYSKWAYTKKAMDDWAHMLRVRLDEVHGIKEKK